MSKESLAKILSSPLGKFSVAVITGDCQGVSAPFSGTGLAVLVFSCAIRKLPFRCLSRQVIVALYVNLVAKALDGDH